jgi:hypothetical protein
MTVRISGPGVECSGFKLGEHSLTIYLPRPSADFIGCRDRSATKMRLASILVAAAAPFACRSKFVEVDLLQASMPVRAEALPNETFAFDAPFGSNMVLQYGTQAAVYGLVWRSRGSELFVSCLWLHGSSSLQHVLLFARLPLQLPRLRRDRRHCDGYGRIHGSRRCQCCRVA